MDYGLIGLILFGLVLITLGGSILFSKKAVNWMYKSGIWKNEDELYGEKMGSRSRRNSMGGRIFMIGLIISITVVISFFL